LDNDVLWLVAMDEGKDVANEVNDDEDF